MATEPVLSISFRPAARFPIADAAACALRHAAPSPSDSPLDRLLRLAAALFDAPSGAVLLIDGDGLRLHRTLGVGPDGLPETSLWLAHLSLKSGLRLVLDTAEEPLWASAVALPHDPSARFFAGAAIRDGDGLPLGVLCTFDPEPRIGFSAKQAGRLVDLTALAAAELERAAGRAEIQRLEARCAKLEQLQAAASCAADAPLAVPSARRDPADSSCEPLAALTGRCGFADRLEERLSHAAAEKSWDFAVLLLDLDRFSHVNDTMGREAGDALLNEVARRLTELCGPLPISQLARLGSDEFALLAEGVTSPEAIEPLAAALDEALRAPVVFEGQTISVAFSMGIAQAREGYLHPEDLIRDAGTAMVQARTAGSGQHASFTSGMRERALHRLRLESDLRHAIEARQLMLYYQPEIDLVTGSVVGFEALMRWQHPAQGMIAPADFIPIAEETGLIVSLGEWGLREACRQLLAWRGVSPKCAGLRMSVNLSARQFAQPRLAESIARILAETGLIAAADLRVEVTESCLVTDEESALSTMQALRRLGVGLRMDDFGTGYSSLQYLQRYPFDTLKIDRSFVSPICDSRESAEIVRTILDLARSLHMEVVAEGIETAEQLKALRGMGCRLGQGYYFARPLEPAAVIAMMAKRPQRVRSAARFHFDPPRRNRA